MNTRPIPGPSGGHLNLSGPQYCCQPPRVQLYNCTLYCTVLPASMCTTVQLYTVLYFQLPRLQLYNYILYCTSSLDVYNCTTIYCTVRPASMCTTVQLYTVLPASTWTTHIFTATIMGREICLPLLGLRCNPYSHRRRTSKHEYRKLIVVYRHKIPFFLHFGAHI